MKILFNFHFLSHVHQFQAFIESPEKNSIGVIHIERL